MYTKTMPPGLTGSLSGKGDLEETRHDCIETVLEGVDEEHAHVPGVVDFLAFQGMAPHVV